MNVLFITLLRIDTLAQHNIYTDLLQEFVDNGHQVYVLSPNEHRENRPTELFEEGNFHRLKVKVGNIQKTNSINKAISFLLINNQYRSALTAYWKSLKFDLVIYSTPPVVFNNLIKYIQSRDNANTYLLLKDIFPQNAVDIKMIKSGGIIYNYYRKKEVELYRISDYIGCMSPANVEYIIQNNNIDRNRIEVCPNSINVKTHSNVITERKIVREKYDLPLDKTILVYGGNLGKPQDIPFVIQCIEECSSVDSVYFLVVGSGTDFHLLQRYMNEKRPKNLSLMEFIPKEEYSVILNACDIGLIFLDHRFSIPNFPHRILDYMYDEMPVISCTDRTSDVGRILEHIGGGIWCESTDPKNFCDAVRQIISMDRRRMGTNNYNYLINNYTSEKCFEIIMSHFS